MSYLWTVFNAVRQDCESVVRLTTLWGNTVEHRKLVVDSYGCFVVHFLGCKITQIFYVVQPEYNLCIRTLLLMISRSNSYPKQTGAAYHPSANGWTNFLCYNNIVPRSNFQFQTSALTTSISRHLVQQRDPKSVLLVTAEPEKLSQYSSSGINAQ